MTDLDKIKNWIATYPRFEALNSFQIDYTDQIPFNAGLFPSGLVEFSRKETITGDIIISNQYNFGLYCVFTKSPNDPVGSQYNADWLLDFQKWVQEQSVHRQAPTFGNIDQFQERIQAQNGVLYEANEEGTAVYMVTLSVQFKKLYEVI